MNAPADPAVILRTVRSNDLLRVNGTFIRELGLATEELAAHPLIEWIHPDDTATLNEALGAGEGCARARHRTKGGDWIPFDWRVVPEASGPVALGRYRARGTAKLPVSTDPLPAETLSQTLDAMARIVEQKNPGMRCSILLVDAAHERVSVGAGPSLPAGYNEAIEGLKIGPAVGSCGTAVFWNMPVVVENIATDPLWRDLRDAAAIAGVSACWSHPITATDGTVLGAMALYDNEPRAPSRSQMDGLEIAARMVGLAVERERLEKRLGRAEKMEALGVLAGGIAHDFNNMLATVLGNAELAMTRLPEDAEVSKMLRAVATASLSATDLCNQMLAYAGRGAMSTEPLDSNALVKELGGMLEVALSKKATLDYELSEESLGVLADRSQLRQVVLNLITNASEAIGNREGRVVIATSARTYSRSELEICAPTASLAPGEYVRLRVSDTGGGMSAETQSKIFDPFFSTKSGGRGLGLAAVQGIVVRHKGALTLESSPGAGTTFTVLLPRVSLPRTELPPEPSARDDLRCGHILVVEDEPSVREVMINILDRAGYTVTSAGDGQEAVDLFRLEGESIDCVLLDLSLPKLDGEEVFHQMRGMRDDVRMVLTSGFTEQQIMDRFKGAGLAGVVHKPARMHVLLAKIAEALRRPDEE